MIEFTMREEDGTPWCVWQVPDTHVRSFGNIIQGITEEISKANYSNKQDMLNAMENAMTKYNIKLFRPD